MLKRNLIGFVVAALLVIGIACSSNRNEPAAAKNDKQSVEKSLDQAGFSGIRVDWDKDKKVLSLNGRVRSPELKAKAGEVAQASAPGEVVSNQLSIEPVDVESKAKSIEKNLDASIEKDYKAVLIANKLDDQRIRFHSKNGVLTLDGKVKTMDQRTEAEKLGTTVPNVSQVVNKLDVEQKPVQQAAEPR
ncbi:MAG: BON domain-containing protein [Terriglobales bacterium]